MDISLPSELLDFTFKHIVSTGTLIKLGGVCPRWKNLLSHPSVWDDIVIERKNNIFRDIYEICPTLREIWIDCNDDDVKIVNFMKIPLFYATLRKLHLSGSMVNDREIGVILQFCTGIRYLNLARIRVYDPRSFRAIVLLRNLRYLDLSDNVVNREILELICYCCPKIHSLFLWNCLELYPSDFYCIRNLKKLETLDISNTCVDDTGLYVITNRCPRLRRIYLSQCTALTCEGLVQLTMCKQLEFLDVWCTDIDNSTLESICIRCQYLEELNIRNCVAIDSDGTQCISNVKNLQYIQLEWTDFKSVKNILDKCVDLKDMLICGMPWCIQMNPQIHKFTEKGVIRHAPSSNPQIYKSILSNLSSNSSIFISISISIFIFISISIFIFIFISISISISLPEPGTYIFNLLVLGTIYVVLPTFLNIKRALCSTNDKYVNIGRSLLSIGNASLATYKVIFNLIHLFVNKFLHNIILLTWIERLSLRILDSNFESSVGWWLAKVHSVGI